MKAQAPGAAEIQGSLQQISLYICGARSLKGLLVCACAARSSVFICGFFTSIQDMRARSNSMIASSTKLGRHALTIGVSACVGQAEKLRLSLPPGLKVICIPLRRPCHCMHLHLACSHDRSLFRRLASLCCGTDRCSCMRASVRSLVGCLFMVACGRDGKIRTTTARDLTSRHGDRIILN